jgi:fermentation-respiration switch protein FrsA (DUF1100 family)
MVTLENKTRKLSGWRRLVLSTLIVLLGLYAAALAVIFAVQREFIYYPISAGAAPDTDGPPIQVTRIKTADGETLTAWYLPPQPDHPTVLFFNGNAAGLEVQKGRWRRIGDEGVGFLAIGYRGYDGSTGKPTEKGLHEDSLAAYKWLTDRIPADQIVIHGFSLGSGVAVRLASEKPARALVLEAPYTAASDLAERAIPFMPVRWLMLDQYRSRDRIGQVHMPILIVHGSADSVIPATMGEQLFSMAHEPKTFVRMTGSDHNTLTRDGLYDHVWRFLGLPLTGTTAAEGYQAKATTRTE